MVNISFAQFFFCEQTAFDKNISLSLIGKEITEACKDRKILNISAPQSQPSMPMCNISTIIKLNNLKHNYSVLSGKLKSEGGKFEN